MGRMADDEQIEKWIVQAIEKHGGMILQAKLRQAVRKVAGTAEEPSRHSIEASMKSLMDKGTVSAVEQQSAWRGRGSGRTEADLYYKLNRK